jgi:hypothetical protein
MRWTRLLLAGILLGALTVSARGGIFFKKKAKPNPAERVPELVVLIKTDQDDHKRAAAAAELRQYDPKAFPEIVPILIDVLKNDPKPAVRAEAISSLSRIRPVTPEAGLALEQAAAHDPVFRLRMQAFTSLKFYRWAGYRSPKGSQVLKPGESPEPPLADAVHGPSPGKKPKAKASGAIMPKDPRDVDLTQPGAGPDPTVPQRLPQGPAKSPLVPAVPPKLDKPPAPPANDGPMLTPPQ